MIRQMLDELKQAHAALLNIICEMEAIAARSTPDPLLLSTVRWKLSAASRRRQMVIDATILPRLLNGATEADMARLTALREEGMALRASSTEHVGKWDTRTIIEHWDAYRAASTTMTASMRRRIAAEQRLLYPLLGRLDES